MRKIKIKIPKDISFKDLNALLKCLTSYVMVRHQTQLKVIFNPPKQKKKFYSYFLFLKKDSYEKFDYLREKQCKKEK